MINWNMSDSSSWVVWMLIWVVADWIISRCSLQVGTYTWQIKKTKQLDFLWISIVHPFHTNTFEWNIADDSLSP